MTRYAVPRICAACGEDEGLEAHHINPTAYGEQDDTVIWLCSVHHGVVHRMGRSADVRALMRAGRERADAERVCWEDKHQRAETSAYELGVPYKKRTYGLLKFMQRHAEIVGQLTAGEQVSDIYRDLFEPALMSRTAFGEHLREWVYQPLNGRSF